jgi:uncharacterized protein
MEADVPKLIPVPDELSKPFWDAVQERRLLVQRCTACSTLQYPPRPACQDCGSEAMEWHETDGKGHVLEFVVLQDTHLPYRAPDQPINLAIVTLDEDPRINFFSNMPGEEPFQVPVGAAVEVMFEELTDGSLIHEWRRAQ